MTGQQKQRSNLATVFVATMFILGAFFVATVVCSSTTPVLLLTIDNFVEETKEAEMLVQFYAPWAERTDGKTWEAVASSVHASGAGKVAEVDCTVDSDLCNKYNVRTYPTLLYFSKSGQEVPFQGQRSEEALIEFFTKQGSAAKSS